MGGAGTAIGLDLAEPLMPPLPLGRGGGGFRGLGVQGFRGLGV